MSDALFRIVSTATGWKLQFSGTIDVTREQQRAIIDSGLAVMLIAARTGKLDVDFKENGDTALKVTMRVTDATLTSGQLREDAITFLAHGGDQGQLVFPNYAYTGEPEAAGAPSDEAPEGGFDLPEGFDEVASDKLDVDDDLPTEIVGTIHDYRGGATPQPRDGDGPKVGRFDPDMVPGGPAGAEVVGHVRLGPGRKDSVLDDFINEEHPHGR